MQEGELTECSDLRRSLTKLTHISWALTYEAVAAAFTAAADTLALQLTALAAIRCVHSAESISRSLSSGMNEAAAVTDAADTWSFSAGGIGSGEAVPLQLISDLFDFEAVVTASQLQAAHGPSS